MHEFQEICRSWLAWIMAASWQLALLVGLVAVATRLAAKASPRLRHALWLLVLVKAFLPPGLTTPISIGRWGVEPLLEAAGMAEPGWDFIHASGPGAASRQAGDAHDGRSTSQAASLTAPLVRVWNSPGWLFVGWALGVGAFWALVGGRYLRLLRKLQTSQTLDEGPVRVALERAALELKLRRSPDLLATNLVASPFIFGLLHSRIVLPQSLLDEIDDADLRAVLIHELMHWRRHDTWIGWLQTLAQSAFWFHPFLWWANARLRYERECACDDAVLREAALAPQLYGEAILRVLIRLRGRSAAEGGLIGVFERGSQLQDRLEEIMNHASSKRRFGWKSRLAVAALAILWLPMAPDGGLQTAVVAQVPTAGSAEAKPNFPQLVKTVPEIGATEVDPSLGEISVTFDRDMGQGMSWTGGAPLFPPVDESRKPRWTDARTCVLPVKLAAGSYYRLGVNSTGAKNFRSKTGQAAPPAVLYFATKGADAETQARLKAPKIASISPENGAADVDPDTDSLRVTFDTPMDEGMSWTGGGPQFPKLAEGKKPSWSADGLTCTLPVSLEPNHEYQLGLNSLEHINFQSRSGVPLKPAVYKFRTRAKAAK